MSAAIANEPTYVQQSLALFPVKGSQVATGDELILDQPIHPGAHVNAAAVYLYPSHTTDRLRFNPDQGGFYRHTVHHHVVRYLTGPAANLVHTVPEWILIEYVTADGLVGEL